MQAGKRARRTTLLISAKTASFSCRYRRTKMRLLTKVAVTVSPGRTTRRGCSMTSPKLRLHCGVSYSTGGTRLIRLLCKSSGGCGPGGSSRPCVGRVSKLRRRETCALFTHENGRSRQLLVLLEVDGERMRPVYRRRAFVPLHLEVGSRQFSLSLSRPDRLCVPDTLRAW